MPTRHVRRGEIYERRGEPEQALRHYGEALEYWRDADSELHDTRENVSARVTRLAGEPVAH